MPPNDVENTWRFIIKITNGIPIKTNCKGTAIIDGKNENGRLKTDNIYDSIRIRYIKNPPIVEINASKYAGIFANTSKYPQLPNADITEL